jgi:uncharacterized membrane protein YkvA (DUF1232 family)
VWSRLNGWSEWLRREAIVLWFCLGHRQTPMRLKALLCLLALAYTVSSLLTYGYAMGLAFIPDWVPVLGLFDDVLLLPIAVYFVIRWVPLPVRRACRQRAASRQQAAGRRNKAG